jgi:hypothetical protein
MSLPAWLAVLVLFVELPIPLYWFIFHPGVNFWRKHEKTVYFAAVLSAWGPVTAFLFRYHTELLRPDWPGACNAVGGLAPILIGCSGASSGILAACASPVRLSFLATEKSRAGIYSHMRHTRYVG